MEGVIDYYMRNILSSVDGYDSCVTVILRITDRHFPDQVFKHLASELEQHSKTTSLKVSDHLS